MNRETDSKGNIVPYKSTYKTVAELDDNIKIIIGNPESPNKNSTPIESQTPNRIYGILTTDGKRLKSIVFMNQKGKRKTQIDIGENQKHNNIKGTHKHKGYVHTEHGYSSPKRFTKKEKRIADKIIKYANENGILTK